MLLFRSEEAAAAWCARRGYPLGAILTLEQTWDLAKAWYGDRLDPTFRGRSREAAQAILHRLGLTGPFWSFAAAAE